LRQAFDLLFDMGLRRAYQRLASLGLRELAPFLLIVLLAWYSLAVLALAWWFFESN
jgi:hypothetical protein